ncbi:MAG: OmpH family outer membrane protein [Paludibacteraceae bacterium]|nr:OmpH family outer membrane protein [Paludibacteraceae bacterium]
MLKKLFIAALLALPFGVMAQELKIATVNTQEIISVYPAYADANSQLEKQSKQYEDELLKLNQEGQKKLEEYQKLAEDKNTDPAILKAREDEIGALQQRIQLFQQSAREQLQKKQEQLMAPIITAVRNAISDVGNEGKYTFILDQQVMSFRATGAPDVTAQVRKKLNIPANAKPVNVPQ